MSRRPVEVRKLAVIYHGAHHRFATVVRAENVAEATP